MRWARRALASAREAAVGVGLVGWLVIDHMWRRLRGRPALFEELFGDLGLDLSREEAIELEHELENPELRRRGKPNGHSGRGTR